MFKNKAGQQVRVFAFNVETGLPVLGDGANISLKIDKDHTARVDTTDQTAEETEDGFYLFTLTQEETNADVIDLYPESATSTVQVVGTPATIYPQEEEAAASGALDLYGPKRVKTKNMEIEAHSPEVVQRLIERTGSKRVGPTRIPYNVAVPKNGGWCN